MLIEALEEEIAFANDFFLIQNVFLSITPAMISLFLQYVHREEITHIV